MVPGVAGAPARSPVVPAPRPALELEPAPTRPRPVVVLPVRARLSIPGARHVMAALALARWMALPATTGKAIPSIKALHPPAPVPARAAPVMMAHSLALPAITRLAVMLVVRARPGVTLPMAIPIPLTRQAPYRVVAAVAARPAPAAMVACRVVTPTPAAPFPYVTIVRSMGRQLTTAAVEPSI